MHSNICLKFDLYIQYKCVSIFFANLSLSLDYSLSYLFVHFFFFSISWKSICWKGIYLSSRTWDYWCFSNGTSFLKMWSIKLWFLKAEHFLKVTYFPWVSTVSVLDIFSCPEQLNRWPCHSLTHWLTNSLTFTFDITEWP